MDVDTALILGWVLMLVGLAGTVLPALPGTALVLAGALLPAWADGFQRVGWGVVALLVVLAVASWVLEWVAGLMGARRVGASREALIGAVLGTVAGLLMGLVGVLFMPLVGAAVGEWIAMRRRPTARRAGAVRTVDGAAPAQGEAGRAVQVGLATWVGLMLGMAAKVALACMMIGVFAVAWHW